MSNTKQSLFFVSILKENALVELAKAFHQPCAADISIVQQEGGLFQQIVKVQLQFLT